MRNLKSKLLVMASALLVSGAALAALAAPVKTVNIQTSPGVTTEVLLPAGVHVGQVYAYRPDYNIRPIFFGIGAAGRTGFMVTQKSGPVKNDMIVNASNGETYVIWTHSSKKVPAEVVYSLP